ncbi:MAG TPA: YetF domain-containing protein [Gammaproteobacteria bacterium]|nr:YetF domain-containing protein [Gammaproteobacteria bacterium]
MEILDAYLMQIAKAAAYYLGLLIIVRLAGKRMAGQTTTFDLLILITLGVVLQTTALQDGAANALIFVLTVFALHRGVALLCTRSRIVRDLLRGRPRPLVRDGNVIEEALAAENVTRAELLAGLRKLGFARPEDVKLAVLEETGHISAVGRDP